MHSRYEHPGIAAIFSDANKLLLWQETELAVIQAYVGRGNISDPSLDQFQVIRGLLWDNLPDVEWWKERDAIIRHDLNAFIEERVRHLPQELQGFFHKGITSYDTEESAFVRSLSHALEIVYAECIYLYQIINALARQYRYTPMLLRTHGQGAEVGSFGKRVLSWRQDITVVMKSITDAQKNLEFSKISGACGNYTSINPEIEKAALGILGLKPFYGATQILPRSLFVPLASGLSSLTLVLSKIMTDIRLGARSGPFVLYREPFGKSQKGSSAMPHKKNNITSEQEEGLARMALGYQQMISQNIQTWEERSIEQSCVERVAWSDLFHVTLQAIKNLQRVLKDLKVYPRNMMRELVSAKGCYAATEAQRVLKELIAPYGLTAEEGYRIVQLAAFDLFRPDGEIVLSSLSEAQHFFEIECEAREHIDRRSIRSMIEFGWLHPTGELDIKPSQIQKWNETLLEVFADSKNCQSWNEVFNLEYLLRNEDTLFEKILIDDNWDEDE